MNAANAWTAIASLVAAVISALALWRSSHHTRKASDKQTDAGIMRDLNGALLKRLDQLEGRVEATHDQVTNGHQSNLRDDLTKAIDLAVGVTSDIRLMRKDISGIGDDVRTLRNDVTALERRLESP